MDNKHQTNTSSPLFEALQQFLDGSGLEYETIEANRGIRVAMELDNAQYSTLFLLGENNFIAVTVTPFRTPKSRRMRVIEMLNRINFDLAFGNFEMDREDGEIRFRAGFPHKHLPFPTEFWSPFVFMGFGMMNRFWPAIQAICWTNIPIEQALHDALDHQIHDERWQSDEPFPKDEAEGEE
ncbi:MAG: YbjN domain-containing protein [bacterium]|nr:YbjN domain-containing protein [bacterium]